MWVALAVFLAVVLAAVGLLSGAAWLAIPAVLVAVVAAGLMAGGIGGAKRVHAGPRPGSETPEDEPGGPAHRATGHAHRGQAT